MTVEEDKIREKAEQLRQRVNDTMSDIDTTTAHYTGNMGSLCMGVKLAADEFEELIEDDE